MNYTRSTAVDASPAGDTVKQAVVDVDADLTGIVTAYNTHDTATTLVHGLGSGTVCGTTNTQTLTNKTLSSPTVTGTVDASGATISSPTITGATIQSSTLNGLTHTAATTGFTIAGGTSSETLTVSDTMTLALGAANLKWFMNAGATAPEWAKGLKVVNYTQDISATGDVALTGAGFKPAAAIFLGAMLDGLPGFGFTDFTSSLYVAQYAAAAWYYAVAKCFSLWRSATDISLFEPKSADADGMTVTLSKTGSPTGTGGFSVIYLR